MKIIFFHLFFFLLLKWGSPQKENETFFRENSWDSISKTLTKGSLVISIKQKHLKEIMIEWILHV